LTELPTGVDDYTPY